MCCDRGCKATRLQGQTVQPCMQMHAVTQRGGITEAQHIHTHTAEYLMCRNTSTVQFSACHRQPARSCTQSTLVTSYWGSIYQVNQDPCRSGQEVLQGHCHFGEHKSRLIGHQKAASLQHKDAHRGTRGKLTQHMLLEVQQGELPNVLTILNWAHNSSTGCCWLWVVTFECDR